MQRKNATLRLIRAKSSKGQRFEVVEFEKGRSLFLFSSLVASKRKIDTSVRKKGKKKSFARRIEKIRIFARLFDSIREQEAFLGAVAIFYVSDQAVCNDKEV